MGGLIQNKSFVPTGQDLTMYNQVLDFNGDGRISMDDFEALAVRFLAKN